MKAMICFMLSVASMMAAPQVTLENPFVTGPAGSTVGWGFRIGPDATEWIAFTGSLLLTESNPSLGIYVDLIGAQGGPEAGVLPPAPYGEWVQGFDLGNFLGLGYYVIAGDAAVGATNAGTIRVLYERYSGNPLECGDCYVESGEADVEFQVTVEGNDVPEPGGWLLVGSGVLGLLWRRRR